MKSLKNLKKPKNEFSFYKGKKSVNKYNPVTFIYDFCNPYYLPSLAYFHHIYRKMHVMYEQTHYNFGKHKETFF